MKNSRAGFLFATPSPTAGIARFFDWAGVYDDYNISTTEAEADGKAFYLDWVCVGDAFRGALTTSLLEDAGKSAE